MTYPRLIADETAVTVSTDSPVADVGKQAGSFHTCAFYVDLSTLDGTTPVVAFTFIRKVDGKDYDLGIATGNLSAAGQYFTVGDQVPGDIFVRMTVVSGTVTNATYKVWAERL